MSEPITKGLRHCSSGIMLKGERTRGVAGLSVCLQRERGEGLLQTIKIQIMPNAHVAPALAGSHTGERKVVLLASDCSPRIFPVKEKLVVIPPPRQLYKIKSRNKKTGNSVHF